MIAMLHHFGDPRAYADAERLRAKGHRVAMVEINPKALVDTAVQMLHYDAVVIPTAAKSHSTTMQVLIDVCGKLGVPVQYADLYTEPKPATAAEHFSNAAPPSSRPEAAVA